MTQNEKELLLQDLCARLPYGVKVEYNGEKYKIANVSICNETITIYGERGYPMEVEIKKVKPYLFPLSSMSEDQKYEFYLRFIVKDRDCAFDYFKFCLDNGKWYKLLTSLDDIEAIIDWFHKNHLDWRGLIPLELAIDVTGKNIY